MRTYAYRCHDYSLLTPTFKKWLVAPLLAYMPWVVPANLITIASNLFVYLGFFVSLYFHSPASRLAIGACLLIYLIGDHLDGMQAKRTGTGSALGEFCDHYLDAFNNGIILFTAFMVFGVNQPILVAVVLATSYLAHMSVFYEQFKTGWLTFEKLGSLEGVLLIAIVVGLSAIEPIFQGFTTVLFYDIKVIEIVFASSVIGGIATFATTIKRTPEKGIEVWLFTIGLVLVTALAPNLFSALEIFVLITLYASLYVGLTMRGHLVDGIERSSDLVVPVALIFLQFIDPNNIHYAFWLLAIYLFVRICVLVVQTFSVLKVFWVWSNPRI